VIICFQGFLRAFKGLKKVKKQASTFHNRLHFKIQKQPNNMKFTISSFVILALVHTAFVLSQDTEDIEFEVPDSIKTCTRIPEFKQCFIDVTAAFAECGKREGAKTLENCLCELSAIPCIPICPGFAADVPEAQLADFEQKCTETENPGASDEGTDPATGSTGEKEDSSSDEVPSNSSGLRVFASVFVGALAIFFC
jgi:hypothetical protein